MRKRADLKMSDGAYAPTGNKLLGSKSTESKFGVVAGLSGEC